MAELRKLGRYELRSVLGKGAMGVVYEGFDPVLHRRVAVKTILKSVALDEETQRDYAARFVREAQAVGRLNHSNIVQVHDFGVENDVSYIVMEFIQGRELRSFFDAKEKFSAGEAVRVMGELLDALDFAHDAGVIHRDVKPANVMLDAQRRVKLADFGVARVQDSDRSAAGTMVGTPAFMSPEQISGGKIDRRTDVFSAGVVLYQLLTGEQPFRGEGAWTVAKQIMQDDPTPPSALVTNIAPAYDALIGKALAKNPAERFASAKEFALALRATVAGSAPAAAIVPPKPRPKAEAKASETEIEFWRAIQNSTDAAEIEFYLERFPEGTYAPLARHKIAKLKDGSSADAQATVRLEAEARARQEAEAKAKQAAEEKSLREAVEKAKRGAEEAKRRAQAAARAVPALDENATVAIPGDKPAERKSSYAIPVAIAAAVVVAGIGAFLYLGRTPAPAPVAHAPEPPKAAVPAPVPVPAPAAPAKAELSTAEVEKIRKEAEERIRREYADKSAAEQAKAAKAATEKAVQEKQLAIKAAAEKAAQEKQLAARVAAEKAALARAAQEKAAAKAAEEEKAAALAAQEKAAAAKAAEEKLAAAKAAEKAAAAAKAPPATVAAVAPREAGLPGRYAFRLIPVGGSAAICGDINIQEDIEIRAGSTEGISRGQFSDLRFQSAQDGSVSARMWDNAPRILGGGTGEVKLVGRANATGYAGTYEWRGAFAIGCTGRWTLVRK